MYMKSGLY